jgi:hypothetical protein
MWDEVMIWQAIEKALDLASTPSAIVEVSNDLPELLIVLRDAGGTVTSRWTAYTDGRVEAT